MYFTILYLVYHHHIHTNTHTCAHGALACNSVQNMYS